MTEEPYRWLEAIGNRREPAAVPEAAVAAPVEVSVQEGDSLSAIAAANGVDLDSLIAANPEIENPDLIYPGQVLRLP